MKLLRPRMVHGVSIILTLLGLATVAMWVRSYWVIDLLEWNWKGGSVFFENGIGQFRFECTLIVDGRVSDSPAGFSRSAVVTHGQGELCERLPGSREYFRWGGFWIVTGQRWGDYHYSLFVPAWFVSLVFWVIPIYRAVGLLRRRLIGPTGACGFCGYDLRATPDRCPECGQVQ